MSSRFAFHRRVCIALGFFLMTSSVVRAQFALSSGSIDRHALVARHSPHLSGIDPWAPLSVGNGDFAFTSDVTGLQTLYSDYQRNGIPIETLARWSWHSNPNPSGYRLTDADRPFDVHGRTIGFPTDAGGPAGRWLRENPHLYPLPQLAFVRRDGRPILAADLSAIDQTLDLWTGTVTSLFTLDGQTVRVRVAVHPEQDVLAVRVESVLIASDSLDVRLALPRGHDLTRKNNPVLEWSEPASHVTRILTQTERALALEHVRDDAKYFATLVSTSTIHVVPAGAHAFDIGPVQGPVIEFTLALGDSPFAANSSVGPGIRTIPDAATVRAAAAAHWPRFWESGGAVDFSGSIDARAAELERRVVLSQYLTAIQCGGVFPPQETGLTLNSWYGKHHTEMIWWHGAHFALWGRAERLAKQLDWFLGGLSEARRLAEERGLLGARWAKMIGPDGRESPGGNPLIVWNQPHPIHLAELVYRDSPTAATLARYRDLVFDSAACMASMLHFNETTGRYNLGPPLWIAQEIHDQATSANPTYELSYWVRGLKIAQLWRERLGFGPDPEWEKRIRLIAPLPVKDGKYVALESMPDTWDNPASRHDHPSFLMALGQLPGDGVDPEVMQRTFDAVRASWDWETKIWGWDYPMIAMTAARLGRPQDAVDMLLFDRGPNNAYTASGHCPQRGDLPVYLPANGALLAAVAMMSVGWDGAPSRNAPGFPKDGSWKVRSEGLHPLP